MTLLAPELEAISATQPVRVVGAVAALRGLTLLVDALPLPVGSLVSVGAGEGGRDQPGEIVGFDHSRAIVMLLGHAAGVRPGDRVVGLHARPTTAVGASLLGRVVDAMGAPLDALGPVPSAEAGPLWPAPLSPMRRRRITERIATGVRVIDCFATAGKGQRMGIFAGPGVGKSTLLGCIARHTSADVNVIALIGERGREVREFVEESLGEEGLRRSVVVVATSDQSPLMRIRAALGATAVAERFRDEGRDVMLMMDSITRFAHAARQVGLAAGEPPATKGYTPSVFSLLPLLLERAGSVEGAGSITGFYTILVEGDDLTEPVSDAARGVLDGHVILSRRLAHRGQFPAVDVLDSVSRVAPDVVDAAHTAAARTVTRLVAAHREVEDLIQIGAYAKGSDPIADAAIELRPAIDALLQQSPADPAPFDDSRKRLLTLADQANRLLNSSRSPARA